MYNHDILNQMKKTLSAISIWLNGLFFTSNCFYGFMVYSSVQVNKLHKISPYKWDSEAAMIKLILLHNADNFQAVQQCERPDLTPFLCFISIQQKDRGQINMKSIIW